jgi:hypothetical protein
LIERSPLAEDLRADPSTPPLIAKLQACKAEQRRLARKAGQLK